MARSEELYLRISPGRFHYLKNLLEGYDGLAILSSIDMRCGLVRLRFSSESRSTIVKLISAEAANITPYTYKQHQV